MENRKKTRRKMGVLTIKDKKYPLYGGLNLIGRHRDAAIIIKDVNISHQHAIVTILDDDNHYISDFNSSNGTALGNVSLVPFDLHKIEDESVIIFSGYIQGCYEKLKDVHFRQGSSFLDTQNTQIDETCYAADTQLVNCSEISGNFAEILPHTSTQLNKESVVGAPRKESQSPTIPDDGFDFSTVSSQLSDACTQICDISNYPQFDDKTSIHEAETQIEPIEVLQEKEFIIPACKQIDDAAKASTSKDDFSDLATQICPIEVIAEKNIRSIEPVEKVTEENLNCVDGIATKVCPEKDYGDDVATQICPFENADDDENECEAKNSDKTAESDVSTDVEDVEESVKEKPKVSESESRIETKILARIESSDEDSDGQTQLHTSQMKKRNLARIGSNDTVEEDNFVFQESEVFGEISTAANCEDEEVAPARKVAGEEVTAENFAFQESEVFGEVSIAANCENEEVASARKVAGEEVTAENFAFQESEVFGEILIATNCENEEVAPARKVAGEEVTSENFAFQESEVFREVSIAANSENEEVASARKVAGEEVTAENFAFQESEVFGEILITTNCENEEVAPARKVPGEEFAAENFAFQESEVFGEVSKAANEAKSRSASSDSDDECPAKCSDSDCSTDVEGNLQHNCSTSGFLNATSEMEDSIVQRKSILDESDLVIPATQETSMVQNSKISDDSAIANTQDSENKSSGECSLSLRLSPIPETTETSLNFTAGRSPAKKSSDDGSDTETEFDDEDFVAPTQKITTGEFDKFLAPKSVVKKPQFDDDVDFDAPTQKISKLSDSVFSADTQKLIGDSFSDADFDAPTQKISIASKITAEEFAAADFDEDTQQVFEGCPAAQKISKDFLTADFDEATQKNFDTALSESDRADAQKKSKDFDEPTQNISEDSDNEDGCVQKSTTKEFTAADYDLPTQKISNTALADSDKAAAEKYSKDFDEATQNISEDSDNEDVCVQKTTAKEFTAADYEQPTQKISNAALADSDKAAAEKNSKNFDEATQNISEDSDNEDVRVQKSTSKKFTAADYDLPTQKISNAVLADSGKAAAEKYSKDFDEATQNILEDSDNEDVRVQKSTSKKFTAADYDEPTQKISNAAFTDPAKAAAQRNSKDFDEATQNISEDSDNEDVCVQKSTSKKFTAADYDLPTQKISNAALADSGKAAAEKYSKDFDEATQNILEDSDNEDVRVQKSTSKQFTAADYDQPTQKLSNAALADSGKAAAEKYSNDFDEATQNILEDVCVQKSTTKEFTAADYDLPTQKFSNAALANSAKAAAQKNSKDFDEATQNISEDSDNEDVRVQKSTSKEFTAADYDQPTQKISCTIFKASDKYAAQKISKDFSTADFDEATQIVSNEILENIGGKDRAVSKKITIEKFSASDFEQNTQINLGAVFEASDTDVDDDSGGEENRTASKKMPIGKFSAGKNFNLVLESADKDPVTGDNFTTADFDEPTQKNSTAVLDQTNSAKIAEDFGGATRKISEKSETVAQKITSADFDRSTQKNLGAVFQASDKFHDAAQKLSKAFTAADFEAPTQKISTAVLEEPSASSKKFTFADFDEPTQKIIVERVQQFPSPLRKFSSNKMKLFTPSHRTNEDFGVDDFNAPTQKLVEATHCSEDFNYLTPTQKLEEIQSNIFDENTLPLVEEPTETRKSIDKRKSQIFLVPVDRLLEKTDPKPSDKIQEIESQLEVMFDTQNVHLTEGNDRPSNPLAALLKNATTQDIIDTLNISNEENSGNDATDCDGANKPIAKSKRRTLLQDDSKRAKKSRTVTSNKKTTKSNRKEEKDTNEGISKLIRSTSATNSTEVNDIDEFASKPTRSNSATNKKETTKSNTKEENDTNASAKLTRSTSATNSTDENDIDEFASKPTRSNSATNKKETTRSNRNQENYTNEGISKLTRSTSATNSTEEDDINEFASKPTRTSIATNRKKETDIGKAVSSKRTGKSTSNKKEENGNAKVASKNRNRNSILNYLKPEPSEANSSGTTIFDSSNESSMADKIDKIIDVLKSPDQSLPKDFQAEKTEISESSNANNSSRDQDKRRVIRKLYHEDDFVDNDRKESEVESNTSRPNQSNSSLLMKSVLEAASSSTGAMSKKRKIVKAPKNIKKLKLDKEIEDTFEVPAANAAKSIKNKNEEEEKEKEAITKVPKVKMPRGINKNKMQTSDSDKEEEKEIEEIPKILQMPTTKRTKGINKKKQTLDSDEEEEKEKAETTKILQVPTAKRTRGTNKKKQTLNSDEDEEREKEETAKILQVPTSKRTSGINKKKQTLDCDEDEEKDKEETAKALKVPATKRSRGTNKNKKQTLDSDEDGENEETGKILQSSAAKRPRAINKNQVQTLDSDEDDETLPTSRRSRARNNNKKPKLNDEEDEEIDQRFEATRGKKRTSKAEAGADATSKPMRRGRRNTKNETDDSDADFRPESSKTKKLPTAEGKNLRLKPKVVFTMLDSPELCAIIKSLGGSIVDSIEACTVLVTKSVARSLKLLTAVAKCKPICSPDWLHECKKAKHFLDPWDHLMKDEAAEAKWNFSLEESFRRSKTKSLFSGYFFQLFVTDVVEILKGTIESAGGKCVNRVNKSGIFVVIASPEHKSKCTKYVKQNVIIALPEAIFDGVLRQEIVFDRHLLTF